MCLAVPAKVIERRADDTALVDLHGSHVEVCTLLTPDAVVDDWVLIHAGFAIQKLDEDEAAATWAILEDLEHAQQS